MPSRPPARQTRIAPGGGLTLGGGTALVGVLGDPVRHSLSPAMHNAALAQLGLDWVYLALPVAPAELATVLRALEAIDCQGLNVTLPHKRAAAALAAELTPLARRLGAVNTLIRRPEGGWLGSNTDVEGFVAPLRSEGWQGRRAVVLGCGGSALAVLAGLESLGFAAIAVAGRSREALTELQVACGAWLPELQALPWDAAGGPALRQALSQADLVVNTTPVGMASATDPLAAARCPLDAEALATLPPHCRVYDLIYTPRPTVLLRAALERGCSTCDGLEMLVQQGAASLRLWSGRDDVPVDAMRQAAMAGLRHT